MLEGNSDPALPLPLPRARAEMSTVKPQGLPLGQGRAAEAPTRDTSALRVVRVRSMMHEVVDSGSAGTTLGGSSPQACTYEEGYCPSQDPW